MSDSVYVLLATYPGSRNVYLIKGAEGKHIAASKENLPVMRELAQKLLDDNVITTAQIFAPVSEIMLPTPKDQQ